MTTILFTLVMILGRGVQVGSQDQDIQLLAGGVLTEMNFLDVEEGAIVKVIGPVTVAETASLTIGPGIELQFPQAGKITVLGSLRVEGTEENPVLFKAENPGDVWQGIHITGPASRRSVLRYLTLESTDTGVKVTAGASLTARGLTVTSPMTSGLVFEESIDVKMYDIRILSAPQEPCAICVAQGRNFLLDGCDIDRGEGHVIGIQARNTNGIKVSNCKISAGSARGFEFTDVHGNITLTSSTFTTNYGGSLIQTNAARKSRVRMESIRFTSLGFAGHCVKIECPGSRPGEVTVRKAVIYGCDRALDITLNNQSLVLVDNQLYFSHQALNLKLGHKNSQAVLQGNLFYYNSNSDRLPAVGIAITPEDFNGVLRISKNLFQQNLCAFALRILHMSPSKASDTKVELFWNQFLSNNVNQGGAGDKAVIMLKFFDLPANFVFKNNSMNNSGVEYDLALGATSFERGYVVDVSRNSWASKRSKLQIEGRILAHHWDPGRAEVLIEPFVINFEPYVLCEGKVCHCPSGYQGRFCEGLSCHDLANCSGHGNCTGPNVCQCEDGWEGLSCDMPFCPQNCSLRGDCVAPHICNCTEGFAGQICDIVVCPGNCSRRGKCQETGECLCEDGWSGEACDVSPWRLVNNCSGHGAAVTEDKCNCTDDWEGDDCSSPTCASLQYCNYRGNCTSWGSCLCLEGWDGETCSLANCSDVQDCSGHGNCTQPNVCECDVGRSGSNCGNCSVGFWGRDCLPCLDCDHGTCNDDGACSCQNRRWTGSLCDRCAEGFYGDSCLPLPTVTHVLPDGGPGAGGTAVLIQGHNLKNVSSYICRFGDVEVPGVLTAENEIECSSPPGENLTVPVSVKPDIPGESFSDSLSNFTYYHHCPENSCGEKKTPSRGSCVLGACSCNSPWSGDQCSTLRMAPDIAKVPAQEIQEFNDFHLEPTLIEGTEPITWTLESDVTVMKIDASTGLVTWPDATSRPDDVTFTIFCHNDFGSDNETVRVTVSPGYHVTLLRQDPLGPFTVPVPVTLSGQVELHPGSNQSGSLPVYIRIKHGNDTVLLKTSADKGSLMFEESFYPAKTQAGLFHADARHPADSEFEPRVTWSVLGLRTAPQSIRCEGLVGNEITTGIVIENLGHEPLSDLRYTIAGDIENILLKLQTGNRKNVPQDDVIVTELVSGQPFPVNISVLADTAVSTGLEITFTSAELANVTAQINVEVQAPGQVLVINPSELNVTIFRGKERTFEVMVTNTGITTALSLELEPPTSEAVFVLAFDKLHVIDLDSMFLDLDPGESAMLNVLVAPPVEADIGYKRGSIVVRSRHVQSTLWVNLYILSEETVNITVQVEDERACVTHGTSGLSSALVELSNDNRRFRVQTPTDDFGVAKFPGLHEDYYELTVTSANHRPQSSVVFVTAEDEEFKIILEKIAVNLSWVQSDDLNRASELALKTDISPDAPSPVVIVKPSTLDLDDIESGIISNINLRLENRGQVRANNLTIQLPRGHPFLRFDVDSTHVGDIPVNGTVMVLLGIRVLATHLDDNVTMTTETESEHRRPSTISDIPHLLLKILYNGACGTDFPKEVDVIMKRSVKLNTTSESSPPSDVEIPDLDYNIPLEQSVFCEPCLLAVSECAQPIGFPQERARCAAGTFRAMVENRTLYSTVLGGFIAMLELFVSCGQLPGYSRMSNTSSTHSHVTRRECVQNLQKSCEEKYSSPDKENGGNSEDDRVPFVAQSRLVVQAIYDMRDTILPSSWDTFLDPVWFTETAKPILGNFAANNLSFSEVTEQLAIDLPRSLSPDQAEEFFSRLRHFSHSAISNLLGPIMKGLVVMTEIGYSDPFTWYNEELKAFSQSPRDKHLCAKAKLRLLQKQSYVNSHVPVTMEIENGDLTSLLDVQVNLSVARLNDSEDSSHLFIIELHGTPGFEAGNTGLALPLGASGSHQWRVTPLDMAATGERVRYKISAVIQHSFRGKQLDVLIRGDTLTVVASPRLLVHIFYPRSSPDNHAGQDNETDFSVSLKMLIMNSGAGSVDGLKVESAKLSLFSGSTGKSIRCQIHDVFIDGETQPKVFELHLGTIVPARTVLVQWDLLCQEAVVFDNFTLTFVQSNNKGESILSTPQVVMYHEVFHDVRLHKPAYDDVQVDPLVSFNSPGSQRPDTVFRTDTGYTTADVFNTDNIDVHEIRSDDGKTELQILVEDIHEGWYWVEIPFDFPDNQELKVCRRQDAKKLLIHYNVWLGRNEAGNKAIYIFDWFTLFDWGVRKKREASAFNSYFIQLGVANTPPVFPKKKYETSVRENTDFLTIIYNCTATDADNAVTYYDLESMDGDAVPFSVTDSGDILVFGVIDHEMKLAYRMKLIAFDNGNPIKSGTTQLGITVLDENDNVAVFTSTTYSAVVKDNISLGTEFLRVKAHDRDIGENGRVVYFIGGENRYPFDIDSHTGGISTSKFLAEQRYSFPVTATNPNSSINSSAEVIVTVMREEEMAAIFETDIVTAHVRENEPVGTFVINVLSHIGALAGDVAFDILSDVPFSFNKSTGNIYTRSVLDQEERDMYNFTIRALDDTPSGSRGVPPEEVTVLVNVTDTNDNSPSFAFPEIKLHFSEDTAVGKILHTLSAKDPDCGTNGEVIKYELPNCTDDAGCPFGLNQTQGGGQLYLLTQLDHENLARYELTVAAIDGGVPSQTGTASLLITVGDTNDNPPWFPTQNSIVNISKLLPVNSVLFTAQAVDNDTEAVLHYKILDPSRRFAINSDSGVLTLKISLKNADDPEFIVVIVVSDGLMEGNMTLVLAVSQKNVCPPVFKPDVYNVEIKETVHPGSFVEIVFADDDEGDWITYSIEGGNEDGMFHIDSVTGEIMTRYHMDIELYSNFTLKIVARDDHDDDSTSKTGNATVYITVLPVNQYAPAFTEGETTHANISEDAPAGTVIQLPDAFDEDGDRIQYSLLENSDLFSVNPDEPLLQLLAVIDRETTPSVSLTLVATDDGNPSKSAHVSVVIDVLDVNDNPPVLHLDDVIKVTQSAIRLKIPIYQVIASDPDSGNNAVLAYSLTMDKPLLRIDDSGAIYCNEECMALTRSLVVPVVISVQDKGQPPQGTSNTTTLEIIVFPGTSGVNDTEENGVFLEPSSSVAFEHTASGHIQSSVEPLISVFTPAGLDLGAVASTYDTSSTIIFSHPIEEVSQTTISPAESLHLLFPSTSMIPDQSTTVSPESTSVPSTSISALPTAALPLTSYKEICQRPIDAIVRDVAGVFFFQDNYVYRVFEVRRLVVRGYPKSIRRIFASWRRQKISGPINAAVHSKASGYTYLFKNTQVWVFSSFRLVEIVELESSLGLVPDVAIDLPDVGILLVKGSNVYRLVDEDQLTFSDAEPLESVLPGAPVPLDAAFVNTDQKTVHFFSGDLAYDWNVESKTFSGESPLHITEWMDCEL